MVREVARSGRPRRQPQKGDDIHEVAVGIHVVEVHEGEAGCFIAEGKLRGLEIIAVGEPGSGKVEIGRLVEHDPVIDAEHPEEEPFQAVRRNGVGPGIFQVREKGGIVRIQNIARLVQFVPARTVLLGKGMVGSVR